MVGTPLITSPARVFARLTFTGEDKHSEPICCDLSRVASMAPANNLPSNVNSTRKRKFSDSLTSNFDIDSKEKNISLQDSKQSNLCQRKRQKMSEYEILKRNRRAENIEKASTLLAENEQLRRQNEILKNKLREFHYNLQKKSLMVQEAEHYIRRSRSIVNVA